MFCFPKKQKKGKNTKSENPETKVNFVLQAKFLLLPRILSISKSTSLPFTLRRKQFPIKLSYGLSANKAQGQTLERAGIYLGQDFFSHGQAYVAFSRVGDKKNIKVLKRRGQGDSQRPCTMKNVVYKSVLV